MNFPCALPMAAPAKQAGLPLRRPRTTSSRRTRSAFLAAALLLAGFLALAAAEARAACGIAPPSPACGEVPFPAVDGQGRLWVVFADAGHVWLSRQRDGGTDFETAVRVNTEPEQLWADGENRPMLAFGAGDEVFVAWTRRNTAAYGGDIRFARSRDGGSRFEPPRTVNDDGLLTSHRFVAMATAPQGQLYLAWLDKRDQVAAQAVGQEYVGAALYYTVSRDGGASFAANRKVADHSCECCRLALAPAGPDALRVMWRHVFEQGTVRDHAIATLGPEGAQGVRRATEDGWRLDGCPHHGPALAQGEDGWHMAWFSNGEHGRGVLYGFFDAARGETLRVTTLDARPNGGHPTIARIGGEILLAWLSFDGTAMNLMLARSRDAGLHWSEPAAIASTAGAADHPLLVRDPGGLWLSWRTTLDGYRLLPVAASE